MAQELKSTYGEGLIEGIGAKAVQITQDSESLYVDYFKSALGVEKNDATSLFKTRTDKAAKITLAGKTTFGEDVETGESENYNFDSRRSKYKTEVSPVQFTKGVSISRLLRQDAIKEIKAKLEDYSEIVKIQRMYRAKRSFDVFNYSTTAPTGTAIPDWVTPYSDGKALLASNHPRIDGGTAQRNLLAAATPLSEASLESVRSLLRTQKDDRGNVTLIGSGRLILLVPTALEKDACIYTKTEDRPSTSNNDMNIYYGGLMTVMSSKWLDAANGGSDTRWYLIDSMWSNLIYWNRQDPVADRYINPFNKDLNIDSSIRYAFCWADWRGVAGSNGA